MAEIARRVEGRLGAIRKLIAYKTHRACSILGITDGLSEKWPLMRF